MDIYTQAAQPEWKTLIIKGDGKMREFKFPFTILATVGVTQVGESPINYEYLLTAGRIVFTPALPEGIEIHLEYLDMDWGCTKSYCF